MLVVIGTKADLVEEHPAHRQISTEEGEQYARQHRAAFFETSAKDNVNVTAAFDRICFQCFASKLSSEAVPSPPGASNGNSSGSGGSSGGPAPTPGTLVATTAPGGGQQRACCVLQ